MPEDPQFDPGSTIEFEARPERKRIRPAGSKRHIVFSIRAEKKATPAAPAAAQTSAPPSPSQANPALAVNRANQDETCAPVDLVLVLDRSGSMGGAKMVVARNAAAEIVESLTPADRIAAVIFDTHIDVIHEATPATEDARRELVGKLKRVEARGGTALHQGWLKGCLQIASEAGMQSGRISQCYLLTDGQANEGLTDVEQIASQAFDLKNRTGITTNTFGVGLDYNEHLLGPMATAGGGQFHHLETPDDIAASFTGSLGTTRRTVARSVELEIAAVEDVDLDLISQYWAPRDNAAPTWRLVVPIGDLPQCERRVTVRCRFPHGKVGGSRVVRARVRWTEGATAFATGWQEVTFTFASDDDCIQETFDPAVMGVVGQDHAYRAMAQATQAARGGNTEEGVQILERALRRLTRWTKAAPDLVQLRYEMEELLERVRYNRLDSSSSKEAYSSSLRRSRGSEDYRRR